MGLMNAPEYVARPSFWQRWRRLGVWAHLLVVVAISCGIFFGCYGCGRAGDCSPGQIDGQCGLATGMGMLAGLFLGGGFLIFSVVAVLSDWAWRRRQEKLKTAFQGDQ
jgi:hypothetical protein